MATPATGMDKAQMKLLLNRASPENPINFAFAQPKDSGPALLILDKLKNPRACERMLSSAFEDARNPRWGTAVIDPAIDESLVRFRVEKPVTGMARRLVLTLKGTGFRKVEIVLDDGTVLEGAGDDEEEEASASASPNVPVDGPVFPASAVAENSVAAPAAALTQGLAGLIRRIGTLDVDAARKTTMAKVAAAANEQVKAGNLAGAAATIAKLKQVIDASAAPAPSGLDAAATQLTAALAAVEQQVAVLQKAIRRMDDDEWLAVSEIGLKIMMGTFVPGLRAALGKMDGPALLQSVQDASRTIGSDPRIAACDANDFGAAVSIRGTLEPALAAVEAALQTGAKP